MRTMMDAFKSFAKIRALLPKVHSVTVRLASSDATLNTSPYKLHDLSSGPPTSATVTKQQALTYYTQLRQGRQLEAASGVLYKEKKIRGFCHPYSGQEACAVGMFASLQPDDAVITSYRCHTWTHLTGATIKEVLCELTGRITGNVHGKGGSMHMYNKNFYGGNGIVGAQTSLGAGIALAFKYTKKNNVTFAIYGDGAANQGQLYESANIAALWGLPCVFVCENNGFGLGTPCKRAAFCQDYYKRGFYVPGIWVDGMDVIAVREATKWARDYCSSGKGPIFMELATYRYLGHSMSDPGTSYRTREEVQEVRKTRDAINNFVKKATAAGLITDSEMKRIDEEIKKEVDAGVKAAQSDGLLPVDGIYTDIYHSTPPVVVRGTTREKTAVQRFARTEELLKS